MNSACAEKGGQGHTFHSSSLVVVVFTRCMENLSLFQEKSSGEKERYILTSSKTKYINAHETISYNHGTIGEREREGEIFSHFSHIGFSKEPLSLSSPRALPAQDDGPIVPMITYQILEVERDHHCLGLHVGIIT